MTQHVYSRYADLIVPSAIRSLASVPDPDAAISFGPGEPDASLFPVGAFRDALNALLNEPAASRQALQYSSSAGSPALREHICRRMTEKGVELTPGNILVTSGSQQGIHLAAAAFVNPGDRVLVQSPTYPGALQVLRAQGARVESLEDDGGKQVRLIYAMSTFQNPTGATLSTAQKHDLLATARRHGAILVEDDPYEALRYDGKPSQTLQALDAGERTIEKACTLYLGSFSKMIAPGLRLGWVAGPKDIIGKLILMKQSEDLQASSLTQAALVRVLDAGTEALTENLRKAYRSRRDCMLEALRTEFGNRGNWSVPQGGFFVWVNLPTGIDADELQRRAAGLGVTFVPGSAFSSDGGHANALRLSFSAAPREHMAEGVRRLARAYDTLAA
ncbi:MAG: PLP-dependent aminotransferase family protein [Notoacmeibacter sp.]|nr:PLP-dependent aminotransferase family protein [Notoacmeibacter sp.]